MALKQAREATDSGKRRLPTGKLGFRKRNRDRSFRSHPGFISAHSSGHYRRNATSYACAPGPDGSEPRSFLVDYCLPQRPGRPTPKPCRLPSYCTAKVPSSPFPRWLGRSASSSEYPRRHGRARGHRVGGRKFDARSAVRVLDRARGRRTSRDAASGPAPAVWGAKRRPPRPSRPTRVGTTAAIAKPKPSHCCQSCVETRALTAPEPFGQTGHALFATRFRQRQANGARIGGQHAQLFGARDRRVHQIA